MVVIGDQEMTNGTVTPRRRHAEKGSDEALPVETWVGALAEEIQQRRA